jgi:hypothetical protein
MALCIFISDDPRVANHHIELCISATPAAALLTIQESHPLDHGAGQVL